MLSLVCCLGQVYLDACGIVIPYLFSSPLASFLTLASLASFFVAFREATGFHSGLGVAVRRAIDTQPRFLTKPLTFCKSFVCLLSTLDSIELWKM